MTEIRAVQAASALGIFSSHFCIERLTVITNPTTFQAEVAARQGRQRLEALFQSLLHRAFNGEL